MRTPPQAEVIATHGPHITVQCPYCGKPHRHKVTRHGAQHFAPMCGMYRNPDQRAAGYTFTTTTGRTTK